MKTPETLSKLVFSKTTENFDELMLKLVSSSGSTPLNKTAKKKQNADCKNVKKSVRPPLPSLYPSIHFIAFSTSKHFSTLFVVTSCCSIELCSLLIHLFVIVI